MNRHYHNFQTTSYTVLLVLFMSFNLSFAFSYENNHLHGLLPHLSSMIDAGSKGIKECLDEENSYRIKTIVIDAGHGGKDPGCSGRHSREKHIALAVALSFGKKIEAQFPEVRVIYTRKTDVFIPLHERAAIANRSNADVFISIHCNYIPKASFVNGSETYVMGLHRAKENLEVAKRENAAILLEDNYEKNYGDFDPNSNEGHIILSMFQNAHLEQSIFLAEKIEGRIASSAQRHSRGVKQAGFLVLRETTMPSILVETGFLSNRQEENFLNTHTGQEMMAQALFEGFQDYKNAIEAPIFAADTTQAIVAVPSERRAEVPVNTSADQVIPVAQASVYTKNTADKPSQKYELEQTKAMKSEEFVDQQLKLLEAENLAKERTSIPVPSEVQVNETVPADFTPDPFESSNPSASQGRAVKVSAPENANFNTTARLGTPTSTSRSDLNTSDQLPNRRAIRFRVQLAATPNLINTNDSKWQNLTYLVQIIEENDLYKYQVLNIRSYEDALEVKKNLHQQGFTDAFLVAYEGQQRIDIVEALEAVGAN